MQAALTELSLHMALVAALAGLVALLTCPR